MRRIEAGLRASGMPKSEALRLISEFKSGVGDPVGGGEGDPTGRVELAPDSFSTTAALAASLLSVN
ncbi:hypothetical protein D3C72_2495530 [compost metagenome]